mgnify:CR=1 FL=1
MTTVRVLGATCLEKAKLEPAGGTRNTKGKCSEDLGLFSVLRQQKHKMNATLVQRGRSIVGTWFPASQSSQASTVRCPYASLEHQSREAGGHVTLEH